MKSEYVAPTLEIVAELGMSSYAASSDIFIEDNDGFSPIFRP